MMIYRGTGGMWTWLLRRFTGFGVAVFLVIHILDTALIGWGPGLFNKVMQIYHSPLFKIGEVFLVGAVLYHAISGLHIIISDFWDTATDYQKQLLYMEVIVFIIAYGTAAFLMLKPLIL
jgi:succinate dehydrogenase / fumarate reductase cytochrome b subunit